MENLPLAIFDEIPCTVFTETLAKNLSNFKTHKKSKFYPNQLKISMLHKNMHIHIHIPLYQWLPLINTHNSTSESKCL